MVLPPLPSAQPGDKPDTPAALYSPQPGVLVCCCSTAVAPERAGAWARGVISELQPQRMLLLGSMQVCLHPRIAHSSGRIEIESANIGVG